MAQHSRAQAKNMEFTTIREGLNEMQHWIIENPDAPSELPHISEWERKVDYATLDNFQQARRRWKKT
jgi:hypothetical protein